MRKYFLGALLVCGAVYGVHHLENEQSLKPTIQNSVAKAYARAHPGQSEVVLLESNIPIKFLLAYPGEVDSLVKINGKILEVTHQVEFFGVTPVISFFTGQGIFRVRITEETRKKLKELKRE